jgi:hypothetical protein
MPQAIKSAIVFTVLKRDVEHDVGIRNKLRKPSEVARFTFRPGRDSFTVLLEGETHHSVDFKCDDHGITVFQNGQQKLHGAVTLSNDGECKLRTRRAGADATEELSFWQFRKEALEDLFFFLAVR